MTDCTDRYRDLTHTKDRVLNDDLAALQRTSERERIERYNRIKADEEAFRYDFTADCPSFFTDAEEDRIRSGFRLARLLVAASFYADGEVPGAMADDFVEAELQAVVDFDRYKQFDALTEEQIATRVRRMDGEVYELVREYTSTQLSDLDDLLDDPAVQRDVMERLVERYEDRREKIRQGFFVYVEAHGLTHMVDAIEDAVRAVDAAADERGRVQAALESELTGLDDRFDDLRGQHAGLEAAVLDVEVGDAGDVSGLQSRLDRYTTRQAELSAELDDRVATVDDLRDDLRAQIDRLESVREETKATAREAVREEVSSVVESELSNLHEQQERMDAEIRRLKRERERLSAARDRLDEKQTTLEDAVDDVETSLEDADGGDVVTTSMARLFEMNYLARFDISMHEAATVRTPDGERDVPDGYWEGRSERRSERARLVDLLADGEDPERYPHNGSARYELTRAHYLGLSRETELVVEAQVVNNLDAHARNGFDAAPADVDRLLDVINPAVYEAEQQEHHYLLAVASPTGWTDRARRQVAGDGGDDGGSRFSRRASVCLVDLQTGDLCYDDADPVVADNASLFAPPVDAERVADCKEYVREEFVDDVLTDSVELATVCEAGFDSSVAKHAFNELEAAGVGDQLYLDEFGLVLEVS